MHEETNAQRWSSGVAHGGADQACGDGIDQYRSLPRFAKQLRLSRNLNSCGSGLGFPAVPSMQVSSDVVHRQQLNFLGVLPRKDAGMDKSC
jgi:hypothetical protein